MEIAGSSNMIFHINKGWGSFALPQQVNIREKTLNGIPMPHKNHPIGFPFVLHYCEIEGLSKWDCTGLKRKGEKKNKRFLENQHIVEHVTRVFYSGRRGLMGKKKKKESKGWKSWERRVVGGRDDSFANAESCTLLGAFLPLHFSLRPLSPHLLSPVRLDPALILLNKRRNMYRVAKIYRPHDKILLTMKSKSLSFHGKPLTPSSTNSCWGIKPASSTFRAQRLFGKPDRITQQACLIDFA